MARLRELNGLPPPTDAEALVHVRAVGLHPIVKALASHLNFLGGRILHRVVA